MALLFSYGSNYPEQLADRLGRDVETWPAYTDGFERVFRNYSARWGGGVASLIPSPGTRTFGHVTRVSAEDLRILDAREGVPASYLRTEIPVMITQGPTEAQVYIARSDEFHQPSRAYLEAVARTISEHWEPVDWRDIPIR